MSALLSLAGKVAAVTGGGSGIGRAISLLFAQQGAHVVILDVAEESAEKVCAEITTAGHSASFHAVDITDPAGVERAFASARDALGRLDILVNNAGIAHVGTLDNTALEDFERVYQVNVRGSFLCAKVAVRTMLAQGAGVILNMASIASLIGLEERFAYTASKGAILSMTRSIAVDYMTRGIRCNCICPTRVHTPFVDGFVAKNFPGREKEMLEQLAAYQPLGRMGTPEEVAVMALYLCSDEASFITGQAFPIDGGVLAK